MNKETLETFSANYKLKKMAEKTEELINGQNKKITINIEVDGKNTRTFDLDITLIWDMGQHCCFKHEINNYKLIQKEIEKSLVSLKNKINDEIKEICDFCEEIGEQYPTKLIILYEKTKLK